MSWFMIVQWLANYKSASKDTFFAGMIIVMTKCGTHRALELTTLGNGRDIAMTMSQWIEEKFIAEYIYVQCPP